jgi:hypothetical protein
MIETERLMAVIVTFLDEIDETSGNKLDMNSFSFPCFYVFAHISTSSPLRSRMLKSLREGPLGRLSPTSHF